MLSPIGGQSATYQNPLAPNLTDRDLSSHLGPVASKGGLNVGFFYARVQLKSRRAAYNGQFQTRLFVAIQPKGDRYTISKQPITERDAQTRFPAEYAAFKNYQDMPSRGTPLMELPGVSQSQIALLSVNGIGSIEDLLSLPQDIVSQVGMEATTAYKIARAWAERKEDSGADVGMAREVAALEIENKTLRDGISQMEAQMKAMQAQIDAMAKMGAGMASVAPSQSPAPRQDAPAQPFVMPDTDFGGGGEMATGNDDLGGDPNPLED